MHATSRADIPDWLTAGLAVAGRAPSGHNTQPWRFTWNSRALAIGWHEERELPAGDRSGRYLMTSLGAAVESIALTVADYGVASGFEVADDTAARTAGEIEFIPGACGSTRRGLAGPLPARKTTRLPFHAAEPDPVHLGGLQRIAAASGLHLRFTRDRDHICDLADAIGAGTARNLADPIVAKEFCAWLRFPGDTRPDGLSSQALEYDNLAARAAQALLRPGVLRYGRHIGLHQRMAATQARLARAAPVFGLLTAPGDSPDTLLAAGRGMLRTWLEATRHGLRVHPMTAGIDYPDLTTTTLQIFDADLREVPVFCFRIGYGPAGNWARKRPIDLTTG